MPDRSSEEGSRSEDLASRVSLVSTYPGRWQEGADMRRGATVATALILCVLILLSVLVEAWALPAWINRVVAAFPEVGHLAAPAIVWGLLAITCLQIVAVSGLRLLAIANDRRPGATTYRPVQVILVALASLTVLVVAALIALGVMGYSTAGVTLLLVVLGATAVAPILPLGLYIASRSPAPQAHPTHGLA